MNGGREGVRGLRFVTERREELRFDPASNSN